MHWGIKESVQDWYLSNENCPVIILKFTLVNLRGQEKNPDYNLQQWSNKYHKLHIYKTIFVFKWVKMNIIHIDIK